MSKTCHHDEYSLLWAMNDHLRESIIRLFDTNIDTNHAMSKSITMRSVNQIEKEDFMNSNMCNGRGFSLPLSSLIIYASIFIFQSKEIIKISLYILVAFFRSKQIIGIY
ncbi:hypothetical protein BpHYR1_053752 [Brachionus plicatilis]|uniref:Uncharacterized protein n=1 Tax=Brachionus plicatilis TaxID=10195 RepID=A0A3M7PPW0_BRAPC|nr:hypothetical protein BpHYR1_053752 [Brachionus plicatilis]